MFRTPFIRCLARFPRTCVSSRRPVCGFYTNSDDFSLVIGSPSSSFASCIRCLASFFRTCWSPRRPVCWLCTNNYDCSLGTTCIVSVVWPASLIPTDHREDQSVGLLPIVMTSPWPFALHLLWALEISAVFSASLVPASHREDLSGANCEARHPGRE